MFGCGAKGKIHMDMGDDIGEPADANSYEAIAEKEDRQATITLSEALNSKERTLWFSGDEENIAKDKQIRGLYVFENGKGIYYSNSGKVITWGDLDELSDNEIIEKMEQSNNAEISKK